jgi:3-mercaptopyruvate sulfurtransferase SseA
MGQEDVRALDGGLDNWFAANLPMEMKENVRSLASCAARPRAEHLAENRTIHFLIKKGSS